MYKKSMNVLSMDNTDYEGNESERYFVYLISCHTGSSTPVKIGKTKSLASRRSNIQTGCPYKITHVFTITSKYQEEVDGLENLLHQLLPGRLNGEWYDGSEAFFRALHRVLAKINSGGFTYEEIEATPDMNAGPELEIMMHHHDFHFAQVSMPIQKCAGVHLYSKAVEAEEIVRIILGNGLTPILNSEPKAEAEESIDHRTDEKPEIVGLTFRDESGREETRWAFDLGFGKYQLVSTPWYQYGVSFLDIVEAAPQSGGINLFRRVIAKSNYLTIRAIDPNGIAEALLVRLTEIGCSCNLVNRKFVVIDIPPETSMEDVLHLLVLARIKWEHADPTFEDICGKVHTVELPKELCVGQRLSVQQLLSMTEAE
jgi:hypothetical protein